MIVTHELLYWVAPLIVVFRLVVVPLFDPLAFESAT